jgi:Chemoreceptor zinc-binding domain
MGLMGWVKSLTKGESDRAAEESAETHQAAPQAEDGAVLAGLNFKTAIDAHMKWKARLEQCLGNSNAEKLEVGVVSSDDQCVLGKWIHGPGDEHYGHLEQFQEMKTEHARFHRCAGEVLTHCLAGDMENASSKLHSGDYPRTSERVKLHLARLYVQVKDNQ